MVNASWLALHAEVIAVLSLHLSVLGRFKAIAGCSQFEGTQEDWLCFMFCAICMYVVAYLSVVHYAPSYFCIECLEVKWFGFSKP
jgi:hypothetical protein